MPTQFHHPFQRQEPDPTMNTEARRIFEAHQDLLEKLHREGREKLGLVPFVLHAKDSLPLPPVETLKVDVDTTCTTKSSKDTPAPPPPRPMPYQRQPDPFTPHSDPELQAASHQEWERHQDNLEQHHRMLQASWDRAFGRPGKSPSQIPADSMSASRRDLTSRQFEIITYLEECLRNHAATHDVHRRELSEDGEEGALIIQAGPDGKYFHITFGGPHDRTGQLMFGEGGEGYEDDDLVPDASATGPSLQAGSAQQENQEKEKRSQDLVNDPQFLEWLRKRRALPAPVAATKVVDPLQEPEPPKAVQQGLEPKPAAPMPPKPSAAPRRRSYRLGEFFGYYDGAGHRVANPIRQVAKVILLLFCLVGALGVGVWLLDGLNMRTAVWIGKLVAIILVWVVVRYAWLGWQHRHSHALDDIEDFSYQNSELNDQSHMWHGLQDFDQEYASLNKRIAMSNLLQTIRAIAVDTKTSISSDDLDQLIKDMNEFKSRNAKHEQSNRR